MWQGSPQPWALARQALHLDAVSVYFAVLMLWRGAAALHDGATPGAALWAVAGMLPLVALALGLLGVFAWLIARTSVYTLTNERLVMRIGVVLSITFNLPYRRIASVDLRRRSASSGDIAVTLSGQDRIAYLHLWPHARPWALRRTQPMLRGLAQPDEVARVLAQALAHAQSTQAQAAAEAPLPVRAVTERPVAAPPAAGLDASHARAA